MRPVHPDVHGRRLCCCRRKDVHLELGLGYGLEKALLVRAIQALPMVGVARARTFSQTSTLRESMALGNP